MIKPTPKDVQVAKQWIQNLKPSVVPRTDFQISFSRSSGPGGQKVNKTSSKATVTLRQWTATPWIPVEVKRQMLDNGYRYMTKRGDLVIQDDTQRSRELNTDLCFYKFVEELKKTVKFAGEVKEKDKIKWKKVKEMTNEQRLQDKQRRSTKKQARKFDY
jgi:peptidyl-tRNA hydrolase ICT1